MIHIVQDRAITQQPPLRLARHFEVFIEDRVGGLVRVSEHPTMDFGSHLDD